MSFSFYPKLITERLTDLTPELLHGYGIRLLMLDFDNTVIPYTTDTPDEETCAWFDRMMQSGISLCVVSNSHKMRAQDFCQNRGIACVTRAGKPFGIGIGLAMERFLVSAKECAFVGDQIYTDTLGANLNGVMSILVKSIDNHNFWLKARHVLELPWIYAAKKRRINYEKS